ncbi:MAG: PKD domain-containing protein [Thermoplasmatota archaeon]
MFRGDFVILVEGERGLRGTGEKNNPDDPEEGGEDTVVEGAEGGGGENAFKGPEGEEGGEEDEEEPDGEGGGENGIDEAEGEGGGEGEGGDEGREEKDSETTGGRGEERRRERAGGPERSSGQQKARPGGARGGGGAPGGAPPRRAPPRGRVGGRTTLYVGIVALIVIVPVIGLVYFYYGPSGDIKKIDLIAQQYASNMESGMLLVVHVDTGKPSSLSGTADLRVSLNGTLTCTETLHIEESRATKKLPFRAFVVANGQYGVEVSFQGKRASTTFVVANVIERVSATAHVMTNKLNPDLVQPGKARIGLIVNFMDGTGVSQKAAESDALEISIARAGEAAATYTPKIGGLMLYTANYGVSGNGNYTATVTFINSNVKEVSSLSRITVQALDVNSSQPTIRVAIPPTADAGPDMKVQWKLLTGGAVVHFDGTASIAYEDATLVSYYWNFGDETGEEGAKVTHTYTKKPDSGSSLVYRVILTVTDSNDEFAEDEAIVTVTL